MNTFFMSEGLDVDFGDETKEKQVVHVMFGTLVGTLNTIQTGKYTKLKFDCNVQHLKYIQGSETLLILIITIIIVMIMIIGACVHFMALWKSNGKRTATPKARGHLHVF